MFDPEGKTIAPPHVSNGPPLKCSPGVVWLVVR